MLLPTVNPTAVMPLATETLYVPLPAVVNPAASVLFHTTSEVPLDQFVVVVSQVPVPLLPPEPVRLGSQFSVVAVELEMPTPAMSNAAAAPAERRVILRRD
jgi:hypothetical protein